MSVYIYIYYIYSIVNNMPKVDIFELTELYL